MSYDIGVESFFRKLNDILGAEFFRFKDDAIVFAEIVKLENVEVKKVEAVATRDLYEVVADIDGDRKEIVIYSGGLKEIWVEDVIDMIETIVLHSSAFRKMVKRMFREHLNVECDDIVHGRIFFGVSAEMLDLRLMVYHDNIFMDFNITRDGMLVLLSYGIYCGKWEQGIVKDYIHGLIAAKAMDEVMR